MPIRLRCLALLLPAILAGFVVCGTSKLPAVPFIPEPQAPKPATDTFDSKIKPFLNTYCNTCHNSKKHSGDVSLDVYMSEAHARKDRKMWEVVEEQIASGDMPPKGKPQPTKAEKAFVLSWIETALTKVDCTVPKDPGRVTLRRLNRAEYNNTVRDLCGVNFRPADDFPSDDVGYGFDNIGDVLSLPPIMLEKYLSAADKVLDGVLTPLDPIPSSKQLFKTQNIQATPRSARVRDSRNAQPKILLTTEGSAFLEKFNFPASGNYIVRIKGWGIPQGATAPLLAIRVDGMDLETFPIEGTAQKMLTVEAKVKVEVGERRVAAVFANPSDPDKLKDDETPRSLGIETIEVEGPLGGAPRPLTDAAKLLYFSLPTAKADWTESARKVLGNFARRAFRRPVAPSELERLMKLFAVAAANEDSFDKALRLPLKAILVSPHFLFRIEEDPKTGTPSKAISEFELATRLSYFLWASLPDETLFQLAARGELRKPGVLKAQIERMLQDPKSSALVENFAGQWLMLRSLRTLAPDTTMFRSWDEPLRNAMIKESEMFFENVMKNDRSLLEFLDADYAFVNDRLAKHYGLPNVEGSEFRKVKLPDGRRGGLVTQASILTITSNPTRTSPVKRGKWILENILGTPPPPPAPEVPELPPVGQLKGTLRQQMEQHRANPSCATCHSKLDPLGFGLENFDAIGAWRDQDNKQAIDSSGVLPDGAKFAGPAELRKVLLGKAAQFRRCLADKLTTYALGRGLEFYDKCVLDEIVRKVQSSNDRFSALVLAIAESDAFQKRAAKRSE